MRYGITENHRFILIDKDLQRLKNTLPFMPALSADRIIRYEDSEVEQDHDGTWYEKGHSPQKPLEEAKAEKLSELNAAFETASKEAHCLSSLGFEIDADETANRNVTSLIVALEATGEKTVSFCAYDNTFHEVTHDQLKTLQREIIAHARTRYTRKWALREAIERAKTVEELDAIAITFDAVRKVMPQPDA